MGGVSVGSDWWKWGEFTYSRAHASLLMRNAPWVDIEAFRSDVHDMLKIFLGEVHLHFPLINDQDYVTASLQVYLEKKHPVILDIWPVTDRALGLFDLKYSDYRHVDPQWRYARVGINDFFFSRRLWSNHVDR